MSKKRKASVNTWTFENLGDHLIHRLADLWQTIVPYRHELGGGLLLTLSLLVLLNLLNLTGGTIPNALGNTARALFGWGAIPVTLAVGVLGAKLTASLLEEEPDSLSFEVIIGIEVLFIAGLVIVHTIAGGDDPLALARNYGGGGYVGWSLFALISGLVGRWITGLIFAILAVAGLGLILRLDQTGISLQPDEASAPQQPKTKRPAKKTPSPPPTNPSPTPQPSQTESATAEHPKPAGSPIPEPSMSAEQALKTVALSPSQLGYKLPPLDLLAPPAIVPSQGADVRYQAQIIQDTLRGFGVPAEVVEINRGPTVTQFGVKPGVVIRKMPDGTVVEQRIRVSKINSLVNDLALALSAAPIRIETPVPGRPIVGIEVPNNNISVVSLRGALESDTFKRAKGELKIALGRGVGGTVAVADMAAQPHLLIAGATGSGKSVCINTIVTNLLMTHSPDHLKLLMVDPKMVELISYNGIPHLLAPVVTDFEQVAGALAWVTREMERRYKSFAQVGARNIAAFNQKVSPAERLPFMVVIIDELADLMMLAADEVEKYICRIAQMARATGIHMIIATQRPSTDVVTGLIKANFPARIAFAVSSQIDSRVILDSPGADKLLGKGDMLYMAPDSPKLARLQGCFVSDAEIKNVVQYWKRAATAVAPTPSVADIINGDDEEDKLPWADIMQEAGKDDILKQAIKLVTDSGKASTSFLQRKLGIGYPRASRLMDQLEDEGVVGPADGNNVREVLWPKSSDTEQP